MRIPAELFIGGKVPASLVPELMSLIREYTRFTLAYGGATFLPQLSTDLLDNLEEGVLHLYDANSIGGEFPDLENFLTIHQIHHTRQVYEEDRMDFRGNEKTTTHLDTLGAPRIPAEVLRQVGRMLADSSEQFNMDNLANSIALSRDARLKLLQVIPPEVEPLEPFEIIGQVDEPTSAPRIIIDVSRSGEVQGIYCSDPDAVAMIADWGVTHGKAGPYLSKGNVTPISAAPQKYLKGLGELFDTLQPTSEL